MKWLYCPHCAVQLEYYDDETHGKCPSCSQIWYKSPPPACIGICYKNDKLLLVKRAVDPDKGKWDFPGGFIKEMENGEDAIKREVEEELGIEPVSATLIAAWPNPRYVYIHRVLKPLDLIFDLHFDSYDFKPTDDVAEIDWYDLDDLPELATKHVANVIEELVRKRYK